MKKISTNWSLIIVVIIVLVGSFFLVGWVVKQQKEMSMLDSLFLNIFIAFISGAVTWMIGKRQVREEVMKGFKGETEKAYRRSRILVQQVEALLSVVASRIGTYKLGVKPESKDAILESYRNVAGQLETLRLHLVASMQDWEDIIPEFINDEKNLVRQVEKMGEQAGKDKLALLKKIEDVQRAKAVDKEDKQKQIDLLRAQIETLERKFISEVRQVDPMISAGSFGPTGPSGPLARMRTTGNHYSIDLNDNLEIDDGMTNIVKISNLDSFHPNESDWNDEKK